MQDVEYIDEGDGYIQLEPDKLTGTYVSDPIDAGRPVDWTDLVIGTVPTDCAGHFDTGSYSNQLCIFDQDQVLHLELNGQSGGTFRDTSPQDNPARCDDLRNGCPINSSGVMGQSAQQFNISGSTHFLETDLFSSNPVVGRTFTVCTWVKVAEPESTDPTYIMQTDYAGSLDYLAYAKYNGENRFYFKSKSSRQEKSVCASQNVANPSEWNHVCVTSSGLQDSGESRRSFFDRFRRTQPDAAGSSRRVYINGVDMTAPGDDCKQISQNLQVADSTINKIAKYEDGATNRFFKGDLDEFMAYNRVLSAEEIKYYADRQTPAATKYFRTCDERSDCNKAGGDWTLCDRWGCNVSDIPDSRYIQYKVDFTSPYPGLTVKLRQVSAEFEHECLGEDKDGDGATDCDDCDDNNPFKSPNIDNDGDGYNSCEDCHDEIPDLYPGIDVDEDGSPCELDCEDLDPDIRPGHDNDGDGFVGCDSDPNDHDPRIYPGSDADGDGYLAFEEDCDDGDPNVHPGAKELCGDHIDNDCDGKEVTQCADACENGFIECFNNQPHRCEVENGVGTYVPLGNVCATANTCFSILYPGGQGSTGALNQYNHNYGCYENPTISGKRIENQYGYIEFDKEPTQINTTLRNECFFISQGNAFIDHINCAELSDLLPVTIGMKMDLSSIPHYLTVGVGDLSSGCDANEFCQDGGTELRADGAYRLLSYSQFPPRGNTIDTKSTIEGGTPDDAAGIIGCWIPDEVGVLRWFGKLIGGFTPWGAAQKAGCVADNAVTPLLPLDCIGKGKGYAYLECMATGNQGKPLPNPVCRGSQECVTVGSCLCPKQECYDKACDDTCGVDSCTRIQGNLRCVNCSPGNFPWPNGPDGCICLPGCPPGQNMCGDACCGGDGDEECPQSMHKCDDAALCCDDGKACCGETCCPEGQTCNNGTCGDPPYCPDYGCTGENGLECKAAHRVQGTCEIGQYSAGCECCGCHIDTGTCNPPEGEDCPP